MDSDQIWVGALSWSSRFSLSFKLDSQDIRVGGLAVKCCRQFKAFTPSLYPFTPSQLLALDENPEAALVVLWISQDHSIGTDETQFVSPWTGVQFPAVHPSVITFFSLSLCDCIDKGCSLKKYTVLSGLKIWSVNNSRSMRFVKYHPRAWTAATLKEGVNNTSNNKEEGMDGQTRRRLKWIPMGS